MAWIRFSILAVIMLCGFYSVAQEMISFHDALENVVEQLEDVREEHKL